jgi:hypothetical protein
MMSVVAISISLSHMYEGFLLVPYFPGVEVGREVGVGVAGLGVAVGVGVAVGGVGGFVSWGLGLGAGVRH